MEVMAHEIHIEINKKDYERAMNQLRLLTLETQKAQMAMDCFITEFDSLRTRYHPVVWWVLTTLAKK